ncbi:MAG TPA: hypothetical protein VHA52_09290 [Candidatus Babeliaceae bacterium]|nr:hypothetical protein [Candidatus Babeliaceae bacterium]
MRKRIIVFLLIGGFGVALKAQNPTYTLEQKASDLSIRVTIPGVSASKPTQIVLPAVSLHTNFNKVGIDPSTDICGFATVPANNQVKVAATNLVVCTSGKVFKNLGTGSAGATGTPPYLWVNNYMGNIFNTPGSAVGAGKQLYVCYGACQPVQRLPK